MLMNEVLVDSLRDKWISNRQSMSNEGVLASIEELECERLVFLSPLDNIAEA